MNWNEVAEHRRKVYRTLCQAQQLAVQSGDRIAVLTLGDRIKFHRSRLYYAIDKAGKAAKSARAWPGFVPTDGAQFATPKNRPDNPDGSGS